MEHSPHPVTQPSDETDPALFLLPRGGLGEIGQVRQDGGAGRVAADHRVTSVNGTGSSQSVELHGQDVGVCSTSLPLTSPNLRGTYKRTTIP